MIRKGLADITNPKVKEKAKQYLESIDRGERDFRF